MQADGNLVLYDSENAPVWSTDTHGKGSGNSYVVLQNDGNLVVYDDSNEAQWSSGSHAYKINKE